MAITTIPPKSSATANVAKKTFSARGTRRPKIEITPKENAISVAIGTANPRKETGSDGAKSQNTNTGTIIPPIAPIRGNNAFLGEDSSPTKISRFISKPTDKKNIAMKKSLMRAIKVIVSPP